MIDNALKHKEDLKILLSILSHDLKAPLNSIYAFNSLLRDELATEDGKEGQVDWLNRSLESCSYAMSILDGVNILSKVAQVDTFEELDLNCILDKVRINLTSLIEDTKAQFEIETLPKVKGNEFCATHIITNVIQNSLKFTRENVVPLVKIRPYLKQGLVIEDNGIGVPEENLENMFEMFYRLYPNKYEGTGAGLGIVKRAIELHNGHVWAQNVKPYGTAIFLDFNNVQ